MARRTALVILAVIFGGVSIAACSNGPAASSTEEAPGAEKLIPPDHLQMATGAPPWPAPFGDVSSRAAAAGLPAMTGEGQAVHFHAHLDVIVDGAVVEVPANIGIDQAGGRITPLHTHDNTGIVHIESTTDTSFTLGQFFTEWGVRMGSGCIGRYCAPAVPIAIYADGVLQPGNPAAGLIFKSHQEVAVVVGAPPVSVPNRYSFPPGL